MLNTSPIPNYDCSNSKFVIYVKNVNMGILKQLEIMNFIHKESVGLKPNLLIFLSLFKADKAFFLFGTYYSDS